MSLGLKHMKTLDRSLVALLSILLFAAQGSVPEMLLAAQVSLPTIAQAGPRERRGTQIGQGGRPMIVECDVGQPCRFVGLFNPGAEPLGPIIVDPATAVTCTAGACGTPVPFLVTPALLAGTSVAAAGGLSAGAVAGIAAAAVLPVAAAVGVGVSTSNKDIDPTQTGSQ